MTKFCDDVLEGMVINLPQPGASLAASMLALRIRCRELQRKLDLAEKQVRDLSQENRRLNLLLIEAGSGPQQHRKSRYG